MAFPKLSNDSFNAYLAGVMDSDGSFSIGKSHKARQNANYTPMVQLSWTNSSFSREFLKILQSKYGGSVCIGNPTSKATYPNTRPVCRYHLSGAKVVPFIKDVLPFLHLKRKQAINLLRFRKFLFIRKPGLTVRPVKLSLFQEKLYQYNKSLNTKNGEAKYADYQK